MHRARETYQKGKAIISKAMTSLFQAVMLMLTIRASAHLRTSQGTLLVLKLASLAKQVTHWTAIKLASPYKCTKLRLLARLQSRLLRRCPERLISRCVTLHRQEMKMILGRLSEEVLSVKTTLEKLIVHRLKTRASFHFQWLVFQRVSQAFEKDIAMRMNLAHIRLRGKTTMWLRMRLLNVLRLPCCTRDSLIESSKNSFKTNNKKVQWFSTRKKIAV